jgi:hypothetical protein
MPCAVCTGHVEMRSASLVVWPQNQARWFVSGLASKPLGRFFWFGLKTSGDGFLWFGLKTSGDGFFRFGHKTLVEPQSQGGGGFSGLGLKTGSYGLVIWASKSLRRFLGLGLKTKHATVCRLRHKTNGRVMVWDMH